MNEQASCHADMAMASHCTMQGLPPAAFWAAVAFSVLLTACFVFLAPRRRISAGTGYAKWELTRLHSLRWLLSRRWLQFALQVPLVLILGVILFTGLYGTPVANRNFATVTTWTIWWTLLIVDIVLLGRMWCLVCPWDALASWLRRLALWKRRRTEPLALELPWPRWLRNVYPATALFIGLTWLELGFGVTRSPRATATLGLLMVLLAVIPALLFERRSFCRYGCLIGRICGIYSLLAPIEVRPRDLELCRRCRSHDCLAGNQHGYPCPTGQLLPSMKSNNYCTICSECFKSCPSQNVALNLRPWGADLRVARRPRRDEAILALVMLSLTSFHGLTMTPAWYELLAWVRGLSGWRFLPVFSAGMLAVLVVPGLLFMTFCSIDARLGRARSAGAAGSRTPVSEIALNHAYPLIAVALTYHLAHNLGHLLSEAGAFLRVLSDPLGRGADLFGTANLAVGPLASAGVIWSIQIVLVLIGLAWSLSAAERCRQRMARTPAGNSRTIGTRLIPAAFILLVTLANLWLLAQPMEMRTGL